MASLASKSKKKKKDKKRKRHGESSSSSGSNSSRSRCRSNSNARRKERRQASPRSDYYSYSYSDDAGRDRRRSDRREARSDHDQRQLPLALEDGHSDARHRHEGSGEDPLEAWLRDVDGGRGTLLQFLEPLRREFGDLDQLALIAKPRKAGRSVVDSVDPHFFEALRVESMGQKLKLARGICELRDEQVGYGSARSGYSSLEDDHEDEYLQPEGKGFLDPALADVRPDRREIRRQNDDDPLQPEGSLFWSLYSRENPADLSDSYDESELIDQDVDEDEETALKPNLADAESRSIGSAWGDAAAGIASWDLRAVGVASEEKRSDVLPSSEVPIAEKVQKLQHNASVMWKPNKRAERSKPGGHHEIVESRTQDGELDKAVNKLAMTDDFDDSVDDADENEAPAVDLDDL